MFTRTMALFLMLFVLAAPPAVLSAPLSQETPTPEPTSTPTPEPYRYEVIDEQTVRWDYVISAGDVMIAGLLVMLVFSVWGVGILLITGGRRGNRNS